MLSFWVLYKPTDDVILGGISNPTDVIILGAILNTTDIIILGAILNLTVKSSFLVRY